MISIVARPAAAISRHTRVRRWRPHFRDRELTCCARWPQRSQMYFDHGAATPGCRHLLDRKRSRRSRQSSDSMTSIASEAGNARRPRELSVLKGGGRLLEPELYAQPSISIPSIGRQRGDRTSHRGRAQGRLRRFPTATQQSRHAPTPPHKSGNLPPGRKTAGRKGLKRPSLPRVSSCRSKKVDLRNQ